MLIRREGGAFLQGGGFFRLTIWGICLGSENAPPVRGYRRRGGLVLDVGVFDVVGFGILLGVGVGEDSEGEVFAIIKGIVTDAGDTAEVANACKRTAAPERTIPDSRHAAQVANARKCTTATERILLDFRHAAQVANALKCPTAIERILPDAL